VCVVDSSTALQRAPRKTAKLRVLHNHSVWLPLTENWIHSQVKYLSSEVECLVVCSRVENRDQFSWPELYCYHNLAALDRMRAAVTALPALRLRYRRHAGLIAWAARQTGASVVHSHFGFTGWRYADAISQLGLKHIVSFYGVDAGMLPLTEPVWRTRYRAMFDRIDLVLCEGPHMKGIVEDLGCPPEKALVHHLGVELEQFRFVPRHWRPEEPLRVLIAASFREKKGIPDALEALAKLRSELDLRITVIGDANHHPASRREKKRIVATIERLELDGITDLLGYQPHEVLLEHAYKNHLFLSPSVTAENGDCEGGAPVTITEMAASGMPIVSTTHADIPEVIRHGVGGLLSDEHDVDAIANNVRWLAEHPHRWQEMVIAARSRIESEFDVRVQGRRLADLYLTL